MFSRALPVAAVWAVSVVSSCDEDKQLTYHRFEFMEQAPAARVSTHFRKEGTDECCDFEGIQRWNFGNGETYGACRDSCMGWPRCVGFERVNDNGKSECVLLSVKDEDHFQSHVNTKPCKDGEKMQCHIRGWFDTWRFQEVYKERCNFAGLNRRDEKSHKTVGSLTFSDCLAGCDANPLCVAFDVKRSGDFPIGEQECTHYFANESNDPKETLTWLAEVYDSSLNQYMNSYTCIMKKKYARGGPSIIVRENSWCEDHGYAKIVGNNIGGE